MTATRLGQIFGMDKKTVQIRLAGLPPSSERNGTFVYLLSDAAPYLVDPVIDFEEYLMTVKPSQLPPKLNKAYWDAQRAKQKFHQENGELWDTLKVYDVVSTLLKLVRQTIQGFSDELDTNTTFTEKQRDILNKISDSMLDQMRVQIEEAFKNRNGENDHNVELKGDEFGLDGDGADEFGLGAP